MDFPNERYVRLYVRDTVTWLRLEWDGQNCLTQLLRKADRAGVIDLSGMQPWEAAVVLCRAPEDAAKRGVARMLELGCVVHDGDRLVFPRYIEANECAMSDKQRAKESRARRAVVSQNVTAPSRNESPPSRAVTVGHAATQGATPRHSVPYRAVLNRAEPCEEPARAHEEQGSDHWNEIEPGTSLRVEFQKRYELATQSIPNQSQLMKASLTLCRWVGETARLRKLPEIDVERRLLEGFFSSPAARGKGFPPAFLAANPLEYFDPKPVVKDDPKLAANTQLLGSVLQELAAARKRVRDADPDSYEHIKATNEASALQGRVDKLKTATGDS